MTLNNELIPKENTKNLMLQLTNTIGREKDENSPILRLP